MSSSDVKGTGMDAAPKMPGPGPHTKEVLHQRGKLPISPAKMAVGGVVIVLTIGYLTLYSKKKPEATAIDVARVATGVSSAPPGNTQRHK